MFNRFPPLLHPFPVSFIISYPGYVYENSTDTCVRAERGTFSPGGYKASPFYCPPNTTTDPDVTTPLTALTDCLCKPGYEPASPMALNDPDSAEWQFREWLQKIDEYSGIEDRQICIPCGFSRYKETVSFDSCKACPTASYTPRENSSDKTDCHLCKPGYYETNNEDIPCGQCLPDAFCVGSEPPIAALHVFKGTKKDCPTHSGTLSGTVDNDHPFKCM